MSERFRKIINNVGYIGAVITSIIYLVLAYIMIVGFTLDADFTDSLLFAIINAVVGFIILQCLKSQGVIAAENIPENKALLSEYYSTKTKDKKFHSLLYYWITSICKDVFIKCLTVGITSISLIYIVIEAQGDFLLMLLAIANLLMFISFGLLGMTKAYNFTCNEHMGYIKEKLNEVNLKTKNNNIPETIPPLEAVSVLPDPVVCDQRLGVDRNTSDTNSGA